MYIEQNIRCIFHESLHSVIVIIILITLSRLILNNKVLKKLAIKSQYLSHHKPYPYINHAA